jgi:phenazine biosynthesis protein PhzF family
MEAKIYHIDAFSDELFCGNPACVILLPYEISDDLMLSIAAENGVAETAFLMKKQKSLGANTFSLRWFTPDIEMDLCGHATIAAAYVVYNILDLDRAIFETREGIINVGKEIGCDGKIKYVLDFPIRLCAPSNLPDNIYKALNIKPKEVYLARDYILLYESQEQIKKIKINREEFDKINLDPGGVAVTAAGDDCDFVSRFFTPQATILEDPVTGSAHCTLAPFWSKLLCKKELTAKQISTRGGTLFCKILGERVYISGGAICFSEGVIKL